MICGTEVNIDSIGNFLIRIKGIILEIHSRGQIILIKVLKKFVATVHGWISLDKSFGKHFFVKFKGFPALFVKVCHFVNVSVSSFSCMFLVQEIDCVRRVVVWIV